MSPEEYQAKRLIRQAQSSELFNEDGSYNFDMSLPAQPSEPQKFGIELNPVVQLESDLEIERSFLEKASEASLDFTSQANKAIFNIAGAPVDLGAWALRKAITAVGFSEETAERWSPTNSFGGSESLKQMFGKAGVITAEEAPDSFAGYLGMTFGEASGFIAPFLAVTRKVQGTATVTQRIAKQINDEAVFTPTRFFGGEAGAVTALSTARMVTDDMDANPTVKLFAEFTSAILGGVGGYGTVRLGDDLIKKLKKMTPEDAFKAAIDGEITPDEVKQILGRDDVPNFKELDFEFISKPKKRELFNDDGSFNFDENAPIQPSEPKPELKINQVIDEPETPKDVLELDAKSPESTPTPKKPEEVTLDSTRYETVNKLRNQLENTDFNQHPELFPNILVEGNNLADASQAVQSRLHRELAKTAEETGGKLNIEATEKLLDEVNFTRYINQQINDLLQTNGGRILLASKKDRNNYKFKGNYSLRAMKSDTALAKLEKTLEDMLSVGEYDDEVKQLFDDFLNIKPRVRKDAKTRVGEEKKKKDESKAKPKEGEAKEGEVKEGEVKEGEVKEGEAKPKKPTEPKPKEDLSPEEQADKVAKQLQKQREKLQKELKKKQEEFNLVDRLDEDGNPIIRDLTDEEIKAEIDGKPESKPKQQDPEIADLKQRIKWYEEAEAEVTTVTKLEERLKKLASIEGEGDMTTLRQTTKDNLKPPSKTSPKVAELNKKISESKARMRQKLKEIDEAYDEINTPKKGKTKEELEAEAEASSIKRLENQLEELRAIRSGTRDKPDAKPTRKKSEKELDLEARIKFYRDEEKQVIQLEKAKAELDRVASIEAEGNITQLRDETKGKPKMPSKPDLVADINKKINESKARMRRKLIDIDNAQKKIKQEELNVQMFKEIEDAIYKEIEQDQVGWWTSAGRTLRQARQLSLIWQLPSVLAGATTNMIGFLRSAIKPTSTYLFNRAKGRGHDISKRLSEADKAGRFITFREGWRDTFSAGARTFKEGQSVTTGGRGRYDEGMVANRAKGTAQVVSKARVSAQRRLEAANNVQRKFMDLGLGGKFMEILSMSYRAANVVDEIPKRQLIKGRLYSKYLKEGIEKFPDDPDAATNYATTQLAKQWEDQDGIQVLTEQARFDDEVRQVQEELGLALGRVSDPDVYTPAFEKLIIKNLSDIAQGDDVFAYAANAMFPYIKIPMRLFYRSAKTATFFGSGIRAKFLNPYDAKIKNVQQALDDIETSINTEAVKSDPDRVKAFTDSRPELYKRLELLKQRKDNYNAEAFTETLIGGSILAFGGTAGWNGYGTGSMSFMTDEQRRVAESNGIKPYTMFGVPYKDFYPISLGLALATEIGAWAKAKAEDELTKDQDFFNVTLRVTTDLFSELNLTQGVTTTQQIFNEAEKIRDQAVTRLLSGYIPNPAIVRKIVQKLTSGGKVSDLKGASFYERVAYYALGIGATNKKTDRFGYEIDDDKNFGQTFVMRQFPSLGKKKLNKFDRIMRTDREGLIEPKPNSLASRVNMYDWRDREGVSLKTAYDKHLRKLRIDGQTMRQAVLEKLRTPEWNKIFNMEYYENENGKAVNDGLLELNTLMKKYYTQAKKDLIADTRLMRKFINEDGVRLDQELAKRKTKDQIRPQRQASVASQYD